MTSQLELHGLWATHRGVCDGGAKNQDILSTTVLQP